MIIDERVLVRFIRYMIRMVVSDIIYDAEISERKIPDKSGICVCSWSSLRHRHSTSYLFRPYIRYTRNTKDTNSHPSSLDKYKYYIATRDNTLKTFSSMGFIQKKTSFGPILIFLGMIKFFPRPHLSHSFLLFSSLHEQYVRGFLVTIENDAFTLILKKKGPFWDQRGNQPHKCPDG